MVESMWKGADIFFLPGTLHIVVTDRVRMAVEDLRATNVRFGAY